MTVKLNVLIRFVGRFALVPDGDTLRVIAADMTFNPALGFKPHQPLLLIEANRVTQGREHSMATILPSVADAKNLVEYSCWDFAHCDLSFAGIDPSTKLTITTVHPVRSLDTLTPGAKLDPKALATPPTGAAVSARVLVTAGTVSTIKQDEGDTTKSVFVPMTQTTAPTPDQAQNAELLADAVEVTCSLAAGVNALTISLKPFAGGAARSITVVPRQEAAATLVLSITNLCKDGDPVRKDSEFSALYELLDARPHADTRQVPFRLDAGKGGVGSGQCDNLCMIPN